MIAAAATLASHATPDAVRVVDELEGLRGDWSRLAVASGNVFATWEWNDLWWRHYGGGRALRIAVLRGDDGEPDAIVPFYAWARRPFGILRLIGHGHGDHLGPICGRDEHETAVRALRLALEAEPHDVFVGDWVTAERDWTNVLGGRIVRRTGYPILRLASESWAGFLSDRSQRFRKTTRNIRNRLERAHEVRYRYADAASLERDLGTTFRLHRARFGAHAGCLFCGEHEPFQRAFAELALERGWLRLLLLELDGQAACVEYGFAFEDAYFAYQGGRDPAWERYSVGFLLELESIRRAVGEGAREYRFLGGEEGYKYRYPTEDPRLETVAVPATLRGRFAAAALHAAWRFPAGEAALRRIATTRSG